MTSIDDETHEIVGVEKDGVFKIIDNITNTISDMCHPQIFPNIGVNTIDGKSVIVINIYPGANRPYYIKSLGKRQALTSEYRERPDPLMKRPNRIVKKRR
jgi:predicted HTH transcriptional regulator